MTDEQLETIRAALAVLLEHFDTAKPNAEDAKALRDIGNAMANLAKRGGLGSRMASVHDAMTRVARSADRVSLACERLWRLPVAELAALDAFANATAEALAEIEAKLGLAP